jgi:hypothetical protein
MPESDPGMRLTDQCLVSLNANLLTHDVRNITRISESDVLGCAWLDQSDVQSLLDMHSTIETVENVQTAWSKKCNAS